MSDFSTAPVATYGVWTDRNHCGPDDAAPFPAATWHYCAPDLPTCDCCGARVASLLIDAKSHRPGCSAARAARQAAALLLIENEAGVLRSELQGLGL